MPWFLFKWGFISQHVSWVCQNYFFSCNNCDTALHWSQTAGENTFWHKRYHLTEYPPVTWKDFLCWWPCEYCEVKHQSVKGVRLLLFLFAPLFVCRVTVSETLTAYHTLSNEMYPLIHGPYYLPICDRKSFAHATQDLRFQYILQYILHHSVVKYTCCIWGVYNSKLS